MTGQEQTDLGTPRAIAKRYGFPLDQLDGAGQRIGIVDLGGTFDRQILLDDIDALGLSVDPDKITVRPIGGPAASTAGLVETQEDVEIVASICPRAEITVYVGELAPVIDAAVADKNSVISCSWGFGPDGHVKATWPDQMGVIEMSLARAATHGTTVVVAAGDGGSASARDGHGNATGRPDGQAHVGYPASSPQVLSVGGTEVQGPAGAGEEVVWNNTPTGGATGGGVSAVFPLPSWQQAAQVTIVSANDGTTGRVVPDVAAFAGFNDYELVFSKRKALNGGTSAATPLWASLIVLANQRRTAAGKPNLGSVNGRLYELAAAVPALFTDIVKGHNAPTADYPGYQAGVGFDACTGWGSPRAAQLIEALARDD